MTLYINFYSLSRFESLYVSSEYLQTVLDRWTGIKWKICDDADVDAISHILMMNRITFQIA